MTEDGLTYPSSVIMHMKKERLDKVLVHLGLGTRKEVKKLIRQGRIQVDGKVVSDVGMHLIPEQQKLAVDGEELYYQRWLYIMLHKPAGVVSATQDLRHQTVIDLLPPMWRKNVRPVGRLDIDTEGLLLLTNDGQLSHRLRSPKYGVEKEYYVRIQGTLTEDHVKQFAKGIQLTDFKTLPARLKILSSGTESEALITIVEGKFHQVKRMVAAIGGRVTYLKRLRMGPLRLDKNLEPGEYRQLSEEEILLLKQE